MLKELVETRREQLDRLREREEEQRKELSDRLARTAEVRREALGAQAHKKLEDFDASEAKKSKARAERIKKDFVATGEQAALSLEEDPCYAASQLVTAADSWWLAPYFAALYDAGNQVVWQGYASLIGNFDFYVDAQGRPDAGVDFQRWHIDWWFQFEPPQVGHYNHTIWVPFNGFYSVGSNDDAQGDSNAAAAHIDLSARGWQRGDKQEVTSQPLNVGGANILSYGRFTGSRALHYYVESLLRERAYLRVTASFPCYARGRGSYAELFFYRPWNYVGRPCVWVTNQLRI